MVFKVSYAIQTMTIISMSQMMIQTKYGYLSLLGACRLVEGSETDDLIHHAFSNDA